MLHSQAFLSFWQEFLLHSALPKIAEEKDLMEEWGEGMAINCYIKILGPEYKYWG